MSKAPAVDYALRIIEYFATQNNEVGIADISNDLKINKNAVSRILESLLEKNWIYQSNITQKKYSLTLRPFSLINRHYENYDISNIALPYIKSINDTLCDATYLGVKNGDNVMYLIHCNSKKNIRIDGCAGGEYPLHCTAPGKILLAYSEDEEIINYFGLPQKKQTPNTIVDSEGFMPEADKIKKQGYAIDNEEFAKGIICIAVPVFDCLGEVVATIGVSSLTLYDDVRSLIDQKLMLIKNAAEEISKNFGYER